MLAYIARRLLLMIPTLFGILLISFVIGAVRASAVPSSASSAQLQGSIWGATGRFSGGGGDMASQMQASDTGYRGAQGLDAKLIEDLNRQFGFDKPAYERFFKNGEGLDAVRFRQSFFRDTPVLQLIKEKLPVSASRWHLDDALSLCHLPFRSASARRFATVAGL